MDIEILANIAGVLGLIMSIFVFVLTRWERRGKLLLQLEGGDYSQFSYEMGEIYGEDQSVIRVRITNMGGRPIVVNKESFLIKGNNKAIGRYDTDWLGIENIPHPISPELSCEVGIFKSAFEELLGVAEFKEFMSTQSWSKCIIPVEVELSDIDGKKYGSNNRYRYNFYVSELECD